MQFIWSVFALCVQSSLALAFVLIGAHCRQFAQSAAVAVTKFTVARQTTMGVLLRHLVFWFASFVAVRSCGVSDQQLISNCAQPLYALGAIKHNRTSPFTWEVFTQKSREYFSEICKAFHRFDACAEPYKASCFDEEPVRSEYTTVSEILRFLCGEGYTGMVQNFDCFVSAITRREMMQCQTEMVSDSRRVTDLGAVGEQERQFHVCGVMNRYLDCVSYPIQLQCGHGAWYLVKEMVKRPAQLALPDCPLSCSGILPSSLAIFALIIALCVHHNIPL